MEQQEQGPRHVEDDYDMPPLMDDDPLPIPVFPVNHGAFRSGYNMGIPEMTAKQLIKYKKNVLYGQLGPQKYYEMFPEDKK